MPPPPESSIPARALVKLRAQLELSNFKVVDWNLATTKDKPAIDEGVPVIYVVLPPAAESAPNMFGGPTPQTPKFGEAEQKIVKELLDNDGKMIFLGKWEVIGGGFGGGFRVPPYPYNSLLKEWGLELQNGVRIVNVEPDLKTPNGFNMNLLKWGFLPANGFTENPIGRPFRGTRFLVSEACPVRVEKTLPEGVKASTVLSIPNREDYIGAEVEDIVEIVNIVTGPDNQSAVQLSRPPAHGPFALTVAAERTTEGKSKGRVIVTGIGFSVNDMFIDQRVPVDIAKARFDPPPKENLDLFINSLYWLIGQDSYIGRGPGAVAYVRPIDVDERVLLRTFIWGVLPLVVFLPGIVLWYMRRR